MATRIMSTALFRASVARTCHTTASLTRTQISSRFVSTSRPAARASEPPHVPRPIPLDIGSPSSAYASSPASATTSRQGRIFGPGSVIDRFADPVLKVLVYTTAATLTMHLLYHRLVLEELRISTNARVKELESEIAELKAHPVQHTLGGRQEFI